MKTLYKRFLPLICLLFFLSMTKADENASQNRFGFLKIPLENATVVGDRLTLAGSIGGVSVSALINTGLWWGVCKTPGVISQLVRKHQFTEPEKKELEAIKTDFCAQLAPLMATTEITLAGKVSPWPLEPALWQPLFWSGAALSGYCGYMMAERGIKNIPAFVMTYLTAEALSRTVSSAVSTAFAKKNGITHIREDKYDLGQYVALGMYLGTVTSPIAYEVLHHNGIKPVMASFISIIPAVTVGVLSSTISIANAGLIRNFDDIVLAGAILGVGVGVGVGVRAIAARAAAGAIVVAGAGAAAAAEAIVVAGAIVGATAGAAAGAIVGAGAMIVINKLPDKNPVLRTTTTVAVATALALINSLSDYVVYGYPLEQSLSETYQVLLKKFYKPIDYFSTLFQ